MRWLRVDNMWFFILQRISLEFFWHILFFPLWWYTYGAWRVLQSCVRFFLSGNDTLSPLLWLRNLFIPMYGLTDWQGRLISFFIRLVNVFVRGILVLGWLIVSLSLFLAWCLMPVAMFFLLFAPL